MDVQGFEFAVFALMRNVVYLAIGCAVLLVVMKIVFRYMDNSVGINFREHAWNAIKKDPMAVALYFGLRVLGVLIAGGTIAAAFLK